MGIPHLTASLSPFAERCTLDGSQIVIDGPALAFHITNLCQVALRTSSPFSQPTYAMLGDTAVAWLDHLEAHSISVAAVFFDGFLPAPKIPTRLERTCNTSRDLNSYCLSTPTGIPKPKAGVDPALRVAPLFPRSKAPLSGNTLPAPAFSVQAIREALCLTGRYGSVTRLVPGEADSYCAEYVRVHGGVVLTSDSDLLVFDLGPRGSVAFFKDLDAGDGADATGVVALKYCPAEISRRLSLAPLYGMSALAFEMATNWKAPLDMLLQRARNADAISARPEEYSEFMEQYSRVILPSFGGADPSCPAGSLQLDTRVSELVLQYLPHRGESGSSKFCGTTTEVGAETGPATMFLPLLLDSWDRASAWEISGSLRLLAYSLLQHVAGRSNSTVVEYRRLLSPTSKGRPLEVPCLAALAGMPGELASRIAKIRRGLAEPKLQWVVLSMYLDLTWSRDESKESTVMRVLRNETCPAGTVTDTSSWNSAHWLAQIGGTYYSLRILKQILGLVGQEADNLPKAVGDLLEILSSLPSFPDYLHLKDMQSLPYRVRDAGGLALLEELAGLDAPIVFKGRARAAARRKPAKPQDQPAKAKFAQQSQNSFAALANC